MQEENKPMTPAEAMRARMSRKEQKQALGEQEVTAELMTLLKIPPKIKQLIYESAKDKHRSYPLLEDFNEAVTDCPVYFTFQEHKELRSSASLGSLFPASSFSNQWFIKKFLEVREDLDGYANGRPIALLIKWPYMKEPMVVHSIALNGKLPGLRLVHVFDKGDIPRITLEPLSQLVPVILKDD